MDLRDRVKKCMEEGGIKVTESGEFQNYSSINFITAVVSLEDEFDVQFPDEYLLPDMMSDLQTVVNIIGTLI